MPSSELAWLARLSVYPNIHLKLLPKITFPVCGGGWLENWGILSFPYICGGGGVKLIFIFHIYASLPKGSHHNKLQGKTLRNFPTGGSRQYKIY